MPRLVNKVDLAEILGVSERTLTEWQKDERFPFEVNGGRGSGNVYETAKVIAWKIERDVAARAGEKPKDRLDRLKADEIELKIAERLNELAPAEMFEHAWIDHVVRAKTELQALPNRIVTWLLDEHQVEIPVGPIADMINEALAALEGANNYDDDINESSHTSDDGEDGSADN